MSSEILAILGTILSPTLAPVKTALLAAESDPQGALSTLTKLAGSEISDLPELEDEVISEGAALGLKLFSELEAKLSGATISTPAPASNPAPESAPDSAS